MVSTFTEALPSGSAGVTSNWTGSSEVPSPDGDTATTAAGNASGRRDGEARQTATLDTVPRQRSYWMPQEKDLDKRSHLAGFALLAVLATIAFRRQPAWRVLPAVVMLAASTETLQGFTVMREPDLLDLRADLLGAVLGVAAAWLAGRAWRVLAAPRRPDE